MARQNALELLRHDHREVQRLFHRFEQASGKEQEKLCRETVDALKLHTRIDEEVFYPYIRQATNCLDLVEEARVEHTTAKQLISDLESGRDGVHRHAVMKVLGEYVEHHIREEEEKMFPLVEKTGVDLAALGQELIEHRKGEHGTIGASGGVGGAASFATQAHSREEAQRAKWVYYRHGQTLATRNPAVIKAWADARNAKPATSPGGDRENPRVLRFDFPDYDKGLQQVSWDAWCRVFEERGRVFLFQQHLKSGKQSNFFQLDNPKR
jgi:hypothetical protein